MVKCLQAVVVQSSTAPHDARQLPVPCTNQAGNAAHNGGAATKTTGTAKVAGAAAELTLTQCSVCLQVAEFGCSGGINSVAPVKTLVHTLDQHLQQQQTEQQALHIHVTHEDLPSNDFASLFRLLSDPTTSYTAPPSSSTNSSSSSRCRVTYAAVGRSFYEPLFPPASLHVGFSCCALHWLSRAPVLLSSTPHWFSPRVTQQERELGQQQAVADLASFLALRADEFVPGGLLALTFIGSGSDDDVVDAHPYFRDKVEGCWLQLLQEGSISQQELSALSAAANYHRSLATSLASLRQQPWELLHASSDTIEHPAWRQFESGSIDATQLGQAYANMWRAINETQQVLLLQQLKGKESAAAVVGLYYARLAAAMAEDPQCLRAATNSLLLKRTDS
ncbi:S-adenosyl-L-methionine-dependent methyltransferase [Scenedesmus sp. NREL 46B-D3]|nr:S-adenosyl-L-methionine-dependent methyltransferase [Scenedesmus sp. NREL 46B-D3]